MTFQFNVDNGLFRLAKTSENIRAHKEHKIVISYDGGAGDSGGSKAGRLIVSCARSVGPAATASPAAAASPNMQWVYYLKGVTPDGKDTKWSFVVYPSCRLCR